MLFYALLGSVGLYGVQKGSVGLCGALGGFVRAVWTVLRLDRAF